MTSQLNNSGDKIKLSVIVLLYHGDRWIQGCMQSLRKQSLPKSKYEIILVDNGESTPSVKNYKGQENVKVLHFSKNLGFAGGNNKALAHTTGEYILLMNQDVIVHFNCLEELITCFGKDPQAGIISANMFMISANERPDRYAPPPKSVGHYQITAFGYAAYVVREADLEMIPVEFISGNGMCFQRKILEDLGKYLFDAKLKNYAEDLDLSIRLKKTKWRMWVRPQAVVYHYRDESFSGKPSDRLRKLIFVSSNRLLVYYNNLGILKYVMRLPALLLGIPLKVSRVDGSKHFDYINFSIAILFIPFIFVHFCFRAFQLPKTLKRSSNLQ